MDFEIGFFIKSNPKMDDGTEIRVEHMVRLSGYVHSDTKEESRVDELVDADLFMHNKMFFRRYHAEHTEYGIQFFGPYTQEVHHRAYEFLLDVEFSLNNPGIIRS